MTEAQMVAALKVVDQERAALRAQLDLFHKRTAQIASICQVLGGPLSVEPRRDFNPGGPSNPLGQAWLKSAVGADMLGASIRWAVADGLRRLFHEVEELHRAAQSA